MAFDGMFTHAMIAELKGKLLNGRVMKISQPYSNEVIITIRANRKNYPLLLSAHPNYARFQITNIPYKNPQTPTNFTMTLRKYLENARLVAINQFENDRIVYFSFETRNELGDRLPLLLSIEIMGRYSNVILINQQKQIIIDTIKHIGMDQNRYRTLLPGATYRLPPKQNKIDPFIDHSTLIEELVNQYPNREVLAQNIQKKYQGFSKNSALQLADTLHLDNSQNFQDRLQAFFSSANCPTPSLILTNNKLDFTFTNYGKNVTDKGTTFNSLSALLDDYYAEKATRDRVRQQGAKLFHLVNQELKKNRIKLKKLTLELENTKHADEFKVKGELLTTYLYQIKRGMTEITLPNYYDNDVPTKISLSNQLGPSQNAQRYFKKYQKLKNAISYIKTQIELTQNEIKYFEEIQSQLELALPQDLNDIQIELENEGYLKKKNLKKRKQRTKVNQPEIFWASDGTKISVGKNNLQNEKLTLHTARKNEYWLHVKNVPGSHVIVHTADPSEETLVEAAILAAYFSKSRDSANVPVDYVQVRKIRKPNGAKPGFVIYEGQKTLYVTPKKEIVEHLRNKV